jgi:GT2 family glycosyltransferase
MNIKSVNKNNIDQKSFEDHENISVSIVLYKTPIDQLRKCINSLNNFNGKLYLFIIDNSPTDNLRNECLQYFNCEYLHFPNNPGYGTSHNKAIRMSRSSGSIFHLIINADVSFNYDVITPLLYYIYKNPEIGLISPKILNPDGSIQRLCKLVPSPVDLLLRRILRKKNRIRFDRKFELHNSEYNKIIFVPFLSGCFMLIRQSALQEVGDFDEQFFMYGEDIDLTRRIAEKYQTIFYPYVFITHELGAASHKSFRMFLIHSYNIIKYFNKWGWIIDSRRINLNKKTLSQFE